MHRISLSVGIIAAALVAVLTVPASAQATRTWVSGVGDDVNPCSRTAPCKTFAGAISKTAVNGEINCIDPGGFGAVTITKSITIDCDGTLGSVLAAGTFGIIVNITPVDETSIVTIRNLEINGAATGITGIRFISGAALHVYNVNINRFNAAGATSGFGIQFAPSNQNAELSVANSFITDSGNVAANTGAAIQIQPTGTGNARVILNRVQVQNSVRGVFADTTGSTGSGIVLNIRDSELSGNTNVGVAGVAPGLTPATLVNLDRVTSASNSVGVIANGAGVIIRMSNSTVNGNATGLTVAGGGQILSYKTNNLVGNTTEGAPTGFLLQN
jgi:hypothetical protein